MGLIGQALQYTYNRKLQKRQFDFQERMSNTAYQRMMADLEKANLNPMLVAKLGGASTPPGGSASVGPAGGSVISSAKEGARAYSEVQLLKAQAAQANAAAGREDSQRLVNLVLQNKLFQEAGVAEQSAKKLYVDTELNKTQLPSARELEKMDRTELGAWMRKINRVMQGLQGLRGTITR